MFIHPLMSSAILLVVSAIGFAIPYRSHRPPKYFELFERCLSGSVVLAVGVVHVLADANSCLDGPQGYILCLAGIFINIVTELFMHSTHHSHGSSTEQETNDPVPVALPLPLPSDQPHHSQESAAQVNNNRHSHVISDEKQRLSRQAKISALLAEFGTTLHSILIGIGLGVLKDSHGQLPLVIALSFHQFFEGIGIGLLVRSARHSKKVTNLFAGVFVSSTSVGVLIGWAIISASAKQSDLVEGIFNGVASGILIHTALIGMIGAELRNVESLTFKEKVFMCLGFLLGSAILSVIAYWA